MPKTLQISALVVLLAAAILLSWAIYSITWPFEPLTIGPGSFIVANEGKVVRPGEGVLLHIDYCKKMNLRERRTIALVGGFLRMIPVEQGEGALGCHKIVFNAVTIPAETPPGKYHLEFTNEYIYNSLRTISYTWKTDEFQVVAAKP